MKLVIHIDGGARGNPGPAGAGVVIRDEAGHAVLEAAYFLGTATNNVAEYAGLLRALEAAEAAGADEVTVYSDSELLVRQINADYSVRSQALRPLFERAMGRLKRLGRWSVRHVRREANRRADELANLAMDAGEDVVAIDAIRPGRRGPRGGGPRTAPPRRTIAVCTRAPDDAACQAPCRRGDVLVFERTMPAGVCLSVAAELLKAVEARRPGRVRCPVNGCGAEFDVTGATPSSHEGPPRRSS